MVRFLNLSIVFMVSFLSLTVHGSIRLHIADSSGLHEALGKPPSELWYRRAAYEAIRDGEVELVDSDSTYWVDSINAGIGTNAYGRMLDSTVERPENSYMVVGVADEFVVPSTGEYTFEIKGDDALFVVIDGQLLTDEEGKAFLYDGLDDAIDQSLGKDGYPDIKVGSFGMSGGYSATRELDSGSHELEFFYYEGKAQTFSTLYWTPPGEGNMSIVPADAFSTRKNYGELRMHIVYNENFGQALPHEIYKGQCPHFVHLDVEVASGVSDDDTVYFYWDLWAQGHEAEQEGVVDIVTTSTYMETVLVCETVDQMIEFEVWAQVGDRKSPIDDGGSCNIFYCALDRCAPVWEALHPDLYSQCEQMEDGACGAGDNIDPDSGLVGISYLPGKAPEPAGVLRQERPVAVYTVSGRKLSDVEMTRMIGGRKFRSNAPGGVLIVKYAHGVRGERIVRMVE